MIACKGIGLLGCCLLIVTFANEIRGQFSVNSSYCGLALLAEECKFCRRGGPGVSTPTFVLQEKAESEVPTYKQPPFTICAGKPKYSDEPGSTGNTGPQSAGQSQTPVTHDAGDLATKLSNPVASLISVPFQSNFDFGMGSGSGWRYTMNFQPVIPVSLGPKWNMISRTILPVIHQSNVTGQGNSESGIGDITQSLFFSPKESKRFVWAVGPVFLLPTATNDALGTEKLGIGPTALILKQEHGWTYGMLANHIWSVAGSDSRLDVNSTFLQPFLSYNTKDGWTYAVNAESSYDWTGNHWSVPIHLTISKLVKFGKHPISFGGGMRCWATSPAGAPQGCGLRIIVTPLFPK